MDVPSSDSFWPASGSLRPRRLLLLPSGHMSARKIRQLICWKPDRVKKALCNPRALDQVLRPRCRCCWRLPQQPQGTNGHCSKNPADGSHCWRFARLSPWPPGGLRSLCPRQLPTDAPAKVFEKACAGIQHQWLRVGGCAGLGRSQMNSRLSFSREKLGPPWLIPTCEWPNVCGAIALMNRNCAFRGGLNRSQRIFGVMRTCMSYGSYSFLSVDARARPLTVLESKPAFLESARKRMGHFPKSRGCDFRSAVARP